MFDKYDKILFAYLFILGVFLFLTFPFNSLVADEGTHLILSVFYRDLIFYLFETGDFSFDNAYNYGINYLVHYPKLQIAYPPLYHLTNALAFTLFDISETVGRVVNSLYALGSFLLFYLIIKKFFNPKTALLSTFLFSFSPLSLYYSSRAMQDFTMFFFLLLSVYIFSFAIKHITKISRRSFLLFSLVGFTVFLAAMGKQMGGIVIFFFLIILAYRFLKQKNKKPIALNSTVLLCAFLIPLIPYLIVLEAVGGFEINKLVAIGYAYDQGEPTSLFDPYFWVWYPVNASLHAPFTPLFLLVFIFFIYRKEKYWKPLLLWFLVFYVSLTLIPNKEPRFFQIFFLPAYLVAGLYLTRIKTAGKQLFLPAFLLSYSIISLFIFVPTIQYYPSKEISQQTFSLLPKNANIALFSEADPLFSSVIIWNIRVLDEDKNIQIFRACIFDNKTKEEILQTLKENNIHTIVYQTWNPNPKINEIKNNIQLTSTITLNNFTTEIYTVKNFTAVKREKICNYICLTREKVCSTGIQK